VTTDRILAGLGLAIVLAVGSQLLANRLRLPAIIVLLLARIPGRGRHPVLNPDDLLDAAFQPLVSLAVAVVLYDTGLSLDVRRLAGRPRRGTAPALSMGERVLRLTGADGKLTRPIRPGAVGPPRPVASRPTDSPADNDPADDGAVRARANSRPRTDDREPLGTASAAATLPGKPRRSGAAAPDPWAVGPLWSAQPSPPALGCRRPYTKPQDLVRALGRHW
jgi:hypothetical protein